MTAPTSVTLSLAADEVERRGWMQGAGWPGPADDETASVCLEGAIMAALGMRTGCKFHLDLEACPAYEAVMRYLDVQWDLWDWNDAPERTAAEVVAVLRAASLVEAARETRVAVTV